MSRDTLINLIDADPEQPRKVFDETKLAELAESMASNGLAVPILLRPMTNGRFLIVHGERRWRAAQRLGWETIPSEVRELTPDEAHWLSLVENVQRANLSPIEEAEAFQARLDTGLTQEALGQRIGKGRTYIAQKLRLLTLPPPLQYYLNHRAISEGHARELLQIRGLYHDEHLLPTSLTESPVVTPEQVYGIFIYTRPLDHPSIYYALIQILAKHPPAVICEASQLFLDRWVKQRQLPAWEMTAFWWASAAVAGQISVAKLARLITLWWEIIQAAIFHMDIYGDEQEPPDPKKYPRHSSDWWGYRSDLRHAGLIDACLEQRLTNEQRLDAAKQVLSQGPAYPSGSQPWGPYHEAYAAEIAKEAERRERYDSDINPDWS